MYLKKIIEWLELWENEQISGEGTPKAFRIVKIVVVVVFTYQFFFHHVGSIFMLLRLRFRNEFVFGQSATLHTEKLNWTRIWASPVKISSWFYFWWSTCTALKIHRSSTLSSRGCEENASC
jgi:hypothetical protein